jgi:hypothetical protein
LQAQAISSIKIYAKALIRVGAQGQGGVFMGEVGVTILGFMLLSQLRQGLF